MCSYVKNKPNILWLVIDDYLKKKNITQRELARKAGVSLSTIPEIKRGNIKKPSFDLICKLSDGMRISVNTFRKRLLEKSEERGEGDGTSGAARDGKRGLG